MQFGLTIPLQRFLKQKVPPSMPCEDLRFCWDLHVLNPGGRPALFAVHASSRWCFLLCSPCRASLQDLAGFMRRELRSHLGREGFSDEQIQKYFQFAGNAQLTKTHGRRPVAFLNRAVEDLYAYCTQIDQASMHQPLTNRLLNSIPCRAAGHQGTGTAGEFLRKDILCLLSERETVQNPPG